MGIPPTMLKQVMNLSLTKGSVNYSCELKWAFNMMQVRKYLIVENRGVSIANNQHSLG